MIELIAYAPYEKFEDELKHIYFTSFPAEERRDWKQLKELIYHPDFNLYKIFHDHTLAGLIAIWQWSDLTFIEHFAIIESLRGQGIGNQVIMLIIKETNHSIVLEVDEPAIVSAHRRIDFYTRLGFKICNEIYYQPPYHKDIKPVKMLLMSYPESLTQTNFNIIRSKLYKKVYQCNIINFP